MDCCKLPECDRPRKRFGYCDMHGHRFKAHGDPYACHDPAKRKLGSGRPCKAGIPSYGTVHSRLTRHHRTGQCSTSGCQRTDTTMALIHGHGDHTEVRHRWSNPVVLRYSTDPADYVELCWLCHNRYDSKAVVLADA